MLITVNHLTRMQRGYICVAGLTEEARNHVRPVSAGRLRTNLLARCGGPFDMGHIVELGSTQPAGSPPEVEDHRFDQRQAAYVGAISGARFWSILQSVAKEGLREIFGPDLSLRGVNSCVVDPGRGHASLGCLRPAGRPGLYLRTHLDRPEQIRMRLSDGAFDLDLSVTDIRLYSEDHVTPNRSLVERAARRLREGAEVLLSMGLTRPFSSAGSLPPVHWLQVNNLHFNTQRLWRLG